MPNQNQFTNHQLTDRRNFASALATSFGLRTVLALLVGATSLAACATTTSEELGASEAELGGSSSCCEGGTYTCAATERDYDYWVPSSSCPGLTKPRAQVLCQTACGAPCADTGWELTCF
jgi:hypothetical protein